MKSIKINDFVYELVIEIAEYNKKNERDHDTSIDEYYRNRIPFQIYRVIEKAQQRAWEKTHAS